MSDKKITIIPVKFNENFVICSRLTAQNEKLSWAAKGLLFYLQSLPSDWELHTIHLANFYKGGRQRGNGHDAIDEMIKELKEQKYIYYKKTREANGQFKHVYLVFHEPYSNEQIQKMFPEGDYPALDNSAVVNPTVYKGDIHKGDKEKEDIYIKQQPPTPSNEKEVVSEQVVVFSKDQEKILQMIAPYQPSEEIKAIALKMSSEKVQLAVEALEQGMQAKMVGYPLGFLRRALEKGWTPGERLRDKSKRKNEITIQKEAPQQKEPTPTWGELVTPEHRAAAQHLIKEFYQVKDQYPTKKVYETAYEIVFADYEKNLERKVRFDNIFFKERVVEAKREFKSW